MKHNVTLESIAVGRFHINILAIGYGKGIAEDSERHSETRIPMEELVSYDYL